MISAIIKTLHFNISKKKNTLILLQIILQKNQSIGAFQRRICFKHSRWLFEVNKRISLDTFDKDGAEGLATFSGRRWGRYRQTLYKIKAEAARRSGEKLFNGADMASNEEIEALAIICFWLASERGITFFAFNKMMYHLCAKCCKGAYQSKCDIKVIDYPQQNMKNDILQFRLDRHKTNVLQNPIIFAHKDNMLWDAYFSIAIHLILESNPTEKLFPDFWEKTFSSKKDGKKDKFEVKSSQLWKHYFREISSLSRAFLKILAMSEVLKSL